MRTANAESRKKNFILNEKDENKEEGMRGKQRIKIYKKTPSASV